jgi:cob(I)alamin adenosyltransferase
MKIYTRRGDRGETDLLGGSRVAKDHLRVEACGAVDELNASIGAAAAASPCDDLRRLAATIQASLLGLGATLARDKPERRSPDDRADSGEDEIAALEGSIDALEAELAPLRRFILPGGTVAAAAFHLARTVCRRAERRVVALHRERPQSEFELRYLNRLSDLLFVMARVESSRAGAPEIEWKRSDR